VTVKEYIKSKSTALGSKNETHSKYFCQMMKRGSIFPKEANVEKDNRNFFIQTYSFFLKTLE